MFILFPSFPCFSSVEVIAGLTSFAQSYPSSHHDGLSLRYPPLYDVDTDIQEYQSRFDSLRFAALLLHGKGLVGPYESGSFDTAASAWCKQWKHWGCRCTLELPFPLAEIGLPFLRCREEESY